MAAPHVTNTASGAATRDRPLPDTGGRSGRPGREPHRVGVRAPWWFVVPAIAVYLFIVVVPSVNGAFFSFTDWNGLRPDWSFVGLDNFSAVLADRAAQDALVNTLILAAVVTVLQNAAGLLLALGVNTVVKSRYVLRVIFFAPVVLTPLVAGFVWSYLLSPNGAVNDALTGLGLGSLAHDWLGDPDTALYAIAAEIVWQFSGYSMVIYLAGLQAIPREVLEAATIDGAGPWSKFRNVVLPLLNGAVVINVMLCLIGGLKQFDQVMAMTGGGPGTATETTSTVIYKSAFTLGDYPLSIALAVVMTLVIAILAAVQYRLTLRKSH
ncbi:raffinose/stachyose/melibiose transport system permease protein [Streptosporangium becharense]|uniref:Raffinose/stachyose/melibiose transport system permease protein n=1 Tax=Streptosporangium becharense TaxID=1816182 RepID=A0A7W9IIY8_9ACTN|nr:sugar ABC transporter permease [Streptosporangium becharense]MBB2911343.1 raffinose/stachyose/melibiose transport system permease protein [Streptosporangium becharense]MBB5821599.1 raffinose/stachyose/melibiose transport system permease protein [Streptosporangium becharense]